MAVDVTKWAGRAAAKSGGDKKNKTFYKFDGANWSIRAYVAPPCPGHDMSAFTSDLPVIEIVCHSGLNRTNGMGACLKNNNDLLEHPVIQSYLAEERSPGQNRAIPVAGKCSPCSLLKGDPRYSHMSFTDRELSDMKPKPKFLMAFCPFEVNGNEVPALEREFYPYLAPVTVNEGIAKAMADARMDITDPNNAVLVKIEKKTVNNRVSYSVSIDIDTARNPFRLSKDLRAKLAEGQSKDGDINLFRIAANLFKTDEAMHKMIVGESEEKVETKKAEATKPKCFGVAYDATDEECTEKCKFVNECKALCPGKDAKPAAQAKPTKPVDDDPDPWADAEPRRVPAKAPAQAPAPAAPQRKPQPLADELDDFDKALAGLEK